LVTVTGYRIGLSISVVTGSMDVSVQLGGGVSLTVHSLVRSMNRLCVPPPSGNVSVVGTAASGPVGAAAR
jgi:hypothetical protein